MPEEFFTIKEAAAKTGKAEITIRRFVQRIVKGNDSERRAFIRPSPEEMQQPVEGPPPAWRISTKLLREHFPPQEQGSGSAPAVEPVNGDQRIVVELKGQNEMMERQLNVKDKQIESLTTLVHSLGDQLNERLRESNVLMKGLQERMALPERAANPIIDALPATPVPKPVKTKREGKKEAPRTKPARRGWWRRLFTSEKSTV